MSTVLNISQPWLPREDLRLMYEKYQEWAAWYAGNIPALANYYRSQAFTPTYQGFQDATLAGGEREALLHVDLARDIAATSANLLFSEPPKVVTSERAQKYTTAMLDNMGFFSLLLEAAEGCSAYGNIYFKIDIDSASQYPCISIVPATAAIPEFAPGGRLISIRFWSLIRRDENGTVYRMVETRTPGSIIVQTFAGKDDELGTPIILHEDLSIPETGLDHLLAWHIPNKRPNRIYPGSPLGVSDYCGLEPSLTALDEVYTHWIGEVSDGRGQTYVSRNAVINAANGQPYFQPQTRTFVVNSMGDKLVEHQQFNIRSEQYQMAANNLLSTIIASAGYSLQSFGLNIGGNAESGTALNIRERKSFITTAGKQRIWKPVVQDMIYALLLAAQVYYGSGIPAEVPTIEMQDSVQTNINDLAPTILALRNAKAASTETLVRLLHPDYDDLDVQMEVERINEEDKAATPPPSLSPEPTPVTE